MKAKRRRADPSLKIPERKRTELIEWCRRGVEFDYAAHLIGYYKIEIFEQAKRDNRFAVALASACEEGKLADKGYLWIELQHIGYKSGSAMRMAGIGNQLIVQRKKIDPEFAVAAMEAEHNGTDYLEDIATRRGINGSDTLLMFTLKARDRQRFGDNNQPIINNNNQQLNLSGGDRYEFGRRLAFALQYAAQGKAAGDGAKHGGDTQGPAVDTERGAANSGLPEPRR